MRRIGLFWIELKIWTVNGEAAPQIWEQSFNTHEIISFSTIETFQDLISFLSPFVFLYEDSTSAKQKIYFTIYYYLFRTYVTYMSTLFEQPGKNTH